MEDANLKAALQAAEARHTGTLLALEAVSTCLIQAGVMSKERLIEQLDLRIRLLERSAFPPEMQAPLKQLRETVSGVG